MERWGSLILILFVTYLSFSNISFVFFFSFLYISFRLLLLTTTLWCRKAVDKTRETNEEDLARMEDETLGRQKENMGWVPRICTYLRHSL